MKNRLDEMFFSQNSLEIFNKCRMKFKKRYVDGLLWRNTESLQGQDSPAEKGRLFHLLACRYFMGLDDSIGDEKAEYQDIKVWQSRLKEFAAGKCVKGTGTLTQNKCQGTRPLDTLKPEYELRLNENGIRLQAKYDLIAIDSQNRAVIYDWKVQEKPIKLQKAENAFQTKIYRYLLAKAGDIITGEPIKPENITMVYWQASHPESPIKISYSDELFRQDEEFLKSEIKKILNCDYNSLGLKTVDTKICKFCEFCSICNGFEAEEVIVDEGDYDLEWEQIEEVEF